MLDYNRIEINEFLCKSPTQVTKTSSQVLYTSRHKDNNTNDKHRSPQSRSQSAWCDRTTNALTALVPWAKGKPSTWDVTVPDTYVESHIANTLSTPGETADQAAQQKNLKVCQLASTHIFCPIAIETAGTWNAMAIELVREIGRRSTVITEDSRETTFLFQCLSIALQQGNAVSFQNPMTIEWAAVAAVIAAALC